MSYSQDGNFNSPAQDGAKQTSLPLQAQGNFYAKEYVRHYKSVATAYLPIRSSTSVCANLLTYSEQFDNSIWTKAGFTVSADQLANPINGAMTADSILETSANSTHAITYSFTYLTAQYTLFVYLKANGRDWIFIQATGIPQRAWFNLTTGVIGTQTNVTAKMTPVGAGWYLCALTFSLAAGSDTISIQTCGGDGSSGSFVGEITKGVYAFGAQINIGSGAAYVQTTAGTRSVTVPDIDVDDPIAFLVDETAPDAAALEIGMAQWARTYVQVPAPVVRYSTISINKPSPVSLGGTVAGTIYSSTLFSTTAGIVYLSPNLFANNQIYSRTLPICSSQDSGGNTRLSFSTPHGVSGSEVILPLQSAGATRNWTVFQPADYSVISTTILDLLNLNFSTAIVEVAKYVRAYTPGPARIQTKNTKTFYLSGFSVGISAPTDIPIPTPLINDAAFLPAIVGQTSGYLTYDASPLDFWMAPIYQQEIIQINAANL